VLSPEQIAELERALGRDLRRYDKACARIQKELGHLDMRIDEWRTTDTLVLMLYDILESMVTENIQRKNSPSFREGPEFGSRIPRRIRRFLSPIIGERLAIKIVKLRSQFES